MEYVTTKSCFDVMLKSGAEYWAWELLIGDSGFPEDYDLLKELVKELK